MYQNLVEKHIFHYKYILLYIKASGKIQVDFFQQIILFQEFYFLFPNFSFQECFPKRKHKSVIMVCFLCFLLVKIISFFSNFLKLLCFFPKNQLFSLKIAIFSRKLAFFFAFFFLRFFCAFFFSSVFFLFLAGYACFQVCVFLFQLFLE